MEAWLMALMRPVETLISRRKRESRRTMSLDLSQSTSSCSLSDTSLPVLMALMPSIEPAHNDQSVRRTLYSSTACSLESTMTHVHLEAEKRKHETASRAPVVLKAQQEPHIAWFLTSVTASCARQSTWSGVWVMLPWLKGVPAQMQHGFDNLADVATGQPYSRYQKRLSSQASAIEVHFQMAICAHGTYDYYFLSPGGRGRTAPGLAGFEPRCVAANSSAVRSANAFSAICSSAQTCCYTLAEDTVRLLAGTQVPCQV